MNNWNSTRTQGLAGTAVPTPVSRPRTDQESTERMLPNAPAIDESAARVLALVAAASGRMDECELQALDRLDAFRRLGVTRRRFVDLTHACSIQMWTDPLTEYRFTVIDSPAGAAADEVPATIVCEPMTDDAEAARRGAFTVRLKSGTSVAEAHAIARYLQARVRGFCHLEP